MSDVKLGRLIDSTAGRDAVHVAILPMQALRRMMPGEKLKNGIVDPFLTKPVEAGEWFYLCLYQETVTSLRHVWRHPAFPDEPVKPEIKRRSEADVWEEWLALPVPPALHRSFDALPVPKEEK